MQQPGVQMNRVHDASISLPLPALRLSGRSSPVWALLVQQVTARGPPSCTPTAAASPPELLNSCRGPGKGQEAEGLLPPWPAGLATQQYRWLLISPRPEDRSTTALRSGCWREYGRGRARRASRATRALGAGAWAWRRRSTWWRWPRCW